MNHRTPVGEGRERPELRELIQKQFTRYAFGEIDEPLWARILEALGDTPDDWMIDTASTELAELQRKRKHPFPGLYLSIAKKAANRCNDWTKAQRSEDRPPPGDHARARTIERAGPEISFDDYERQQAELALQIRNLSPAERDELKAEAEKLIGSRLMKLDAAGRAREVETVMENLMRSRVSVS
jgi:hypothetical protein